MLLGRGCCAVMPFTPPRSMNEGQEEGPPVTLQEALCAGATPDAVQGCLAVGDSKDTQQEFPAWRRCGYTAWAT